MAGEMNLIFFSWPSLIKRGLKCFAVKHDAVYLFKNVEEKWLRAKNKDNTIGFFKWMSVSCSTQYNFIIFWENQRFRKVINFRFIFPKLNQIFFCKDQLLWCTEAKRSAHTHSTLHTREALITIYDNTWIHFEAQGLVSNFKLRSPMINYRPVILDPAILLRRS